MSEILETCVHTRQWVCITLKNSNSIVGKIGRGAKDGYCFLPKTGHLVPFPIVFDEVISIVSLDLEILYYANSDTV